MAAKKYILEISTAECAAKFIISYNNSLFRRMERKSGQLTDKYWEKLMAVVPQREEGIDAINKQYKTVAITAVIQEKAQTLFSQFNSAYWNFYKDKAKIQPRFNATEGKALKSIISHFQNLSADDAEALTTWQALLTNWHKIEPFYAKQIELRQINSNINTLLRQVKNGNPTNQAQAQANNYADDLRKSV